MRVPESVVVGIEVEFLVAQHLTDKSKKNPGDSRWACDPPLEKSYKVPSHLERTVLSWAEDWALRKSCEILANVGLPAACPYAERHKGDPIYHDRLGNTVINFGHDISIRAWNQNIASPLTNSLKMTDFYYVTREVHITQDVKLHPDSAPSNEYNWYGTELNSPILTDSHEISKGLPTLKKALTSLQNNMVLGLNANCGLHIHVSDGGQLSLQTAQRVACLVLLLEDSLLMSFSHPYRQKKSPYSMRIGTESSAFLNPDSCEGALENDGCVQLKNLGDLREKLHAKGRQIDGRISVAMRRIYSQKSIQDLGLMLRKFNNGPVRTTTRCALAISKHNSIEFRYPAATFDMEYIYLWIQLSRHIFGMALKATDLEFSKKLCQVFELVTRAEKVGWEVVLEVIELDWIKAERWKKYMEEFEAYPRDLNKQGVIPQS